jgi:hypothetical protein
MSYAIIGFGNIGQALAKAFARSGIEVSVATTKGPPRHRCRFSPTNPTVRRSWRRRARLWLPGPTRASRVQGRPAPPRPVAQAHPLADVPEGSSDCRAPAASASHVPTVTERLADGGLAAA